jgi:hypothetical protein
VNERPAGAGLLPARFEAGLMGVIADRPVGGRSSAPGEQPSDQANGSLSPECQARVGIPLESAEGCEL